MPDLKKRIPFFLLVLVCIMLVNFVIMVLPRYLTSRTDAEGPVESKENPYSPWPLSFPKMLGGVILMEKLGPPLALTDAQARSLVEILHLLGRSWKAVHDAERGIKGVLSDPQQQYILRNKHEFEKFEYVRSHMPEFLKGDSIGAAMWLMEKRSKENTNDRSYARPQKTYLLTVFDMSTGIYMMDSADGLALTPVQAREILPFYHGLNEPLKSVGDCTDRMRNLLTADQIRYTQSHMLQVTHAKRVPFVAQHEKGPYDDALIWFVIRMMEKRLPAKAK